MLKFLFLAFCFLVVFLVRPAPLYAIRPSPIHGVGVFSTRAFEPNETIELAIRMRSDTFQITPYFGSLLNHAKEDNIELRKMTDGNYYAVARAFIPPDTELTIDYDGPTIPAFIDGSKPDFI